MSVFWQLCFLALWLFRLALLGRIVFDMVRVLARRWRPVGGSAVALEVLYSTTDPPVKLLRRMIPMVRLGGVGFDLSIIVLLIVVYILMELVVGPLAFR
ncbi:MAG: hypothetical protein BGO26_08690 [Actinobacteria bacterium 69-20]|nr:YggT family protein [Actinomycetota bacterium]OJV25778.1 MAG: hypothetical protein BGO26_08690 [Actinobacteria bacterium 69-20]